MSASHTHTHTNRVKERLITVPDKRTIVRKENQPHTWHPSSCLSLYQGQTKFIQSLKNVWPSVQDTRKVETFTILKCLRNDRHKELAASKTTKDVPKTAESIASLQTVFLVGPCPSKHSDGWLSSLTASTWPDKEKGGPLACLLTPNQKQPIFLFSGFYC